MRRARRGPTGFTLVELLVVIGIIALLTSILLPAMSRARAQANAVKCMANLRSIGQGLVMYVDQNHGWIVPSYNLPPLPGATSNVTGGPAQPLDGWACILDRDRLVPAKEQDTNTTFFCPDTVDVEGMKDGQTGSDTSKPRGWTDWPLKLTTVGGDSAPKVATTIPERGFTRIIRVSYWINAYNPIGSAPADIPSSDVHYTGSLGLGPDSSGNYMRAHRMSSIRRPSSFVVLADGIYMGRQSVTRLGDLNCRIGYRHPSSRGPNTSANVCFADGHAEKIEGHQFPRTVSSSDAADVRAQKMTENLSGPSIYANAEEFFQNQ
ncbi:MAG: type II secretion system protein [Tepidisphaerales bacterium]